MKPHLQSILLIATLACISVGCRHLPAPGAPKGDMPVATNLAAAATATNSPAAPAASGTNQVRGPVKASAESADDAYEQIRLFTKALMLIRQDYVDESKVTYSNLVAAALSGMLQALDPYSQYMQPSDYRDLKEDTQGKFGGIGIQVGMKDGILTVIAPIEDTPAFKAGIVSGDKIVEIDGERTDKLSMRDAIHHLRGEEGTSVNVKIARDKDFKEFTLVRESIQIASVKGARILKDGIGYVRITEFSEPTARSLQSALEKLKTQGMQALVMDLRNNPGGLLSAAIQTSELFLRKGKLIVSVRGRDGTPRQEPAYAHGGQPFADLPLVILVNGGSASASEIVAGALHDNERAILVGETTFGKGSVQNVLQIEDGSALRLTTARYYTPSNVSIHEKGIEPDIVVPVSPEEWLTVQRKRSYEEAPALMTEQDKSAGFEKVTDRQLDRAVDMLKGLLIFESRS